MNENEKLKKLIENLIFDRNYRDDLIKNQEEQITELKEELDQLRKFPLDKLKKGW